MPKNELTAPGSVAPVDRLALSVTSSRPIDQASGITPSWDTVAAGAGFCFADEAAPSFKTSIGFPLFADGAAPSVWGYSFTFADES